MDGFDSEKRAGGRNFQFLNSATDKRAGGRNFQSLYDPEKRAGARPFAAGADKRAGGRAFAALPAEADVAFDKRAGARPFNIPQSWKRGGGRAFSFADDFEKRAGGRAFQLNKRGGGRAFYGGGNRFRSVRNVLTTYPTGFLFSSTEAAARICFRTRRRTMETHCTTI